MGGWSIIGGIPSGRASTDYRILFEESLEGRIPLKTSLIAEFQFDR